MNVRRLLLLTTAVFLLILTACGGTATPAAPTVIPAADTQTETETEAETETETADSEVAATSDRCGDRAQLASEINLFNWAEYMDPDILTQFEEECGVKVNEDVFTSNEDMIARVQAGNSGYDVVIPSDYAVDLMVDRGLLHQLNKENIPNIVNLNPNLTGLYYDPNNEYSVPYQYGATGLAYNTATFETPPDSWAYVFDPELLCANSGFVSMLEDERETVGAALVYLGYSVNDTDPAHHAEALEILLGQKDCLAGYNSDNYNQTLAGEEVMMAHAWTGGTALARDEKENVAFAIPKEGSVIWMDNMAIPMDAPNIYTAEVFINYILDAEIGAQLSNYTFYFTPNLAAEPLLDPYYFELLQSGGMWLTDDVYERLEWIVRTEETAIFADTWTAVKAR
jgi:spermidine/putrescine transport system substrate-binding protein